jgi:hypothetical protein
MSESAVGAIVTNTRQKARAAKNGAVFGETARASVTFPASASVRPRRRSHVPAAVTSRDVMNSATSAAQATAEHTRRRTVARTLRTSIEML